MPVLPVHNAIAVPDSTIYLRPDYYRIMSAGKEPQQDAKVVLLITKEPMSRRSDMLVCQTLQESLTGSCIRKSVRIRTVMIRTIR